MASKKKKVLVKNRHFKIDLVDGKEVWTFFWGNIEKDVKAATKKRTNEK